MNGILLIENGLFQCDSPVFLIIVLSEFLKCISTFSVDLSWSKMMSRRLLWEVSWRALSTTDVASSSNDFGSGFILCSNNNTRRWSTDVISHDDVIKYYGNIFRVTGPLCGDFTGPVEFPTQRPVARSFDVIFDLRLNKRLSKQPWGWWLETPSWSLWRQCDVGIASFCKVLARADLLAFLYSSICSDQ